MISLLLIWNFLGNKTFHFEMKPMKMLIYWFYCGVLQGGGVEAPLAQADLPFSGTPASGGKVNSEKRQSAAGKLGTSAAA